MSYIIKPSFGILNLKSKDDDWQILNLADHQSNGVEVVCISGNGATNEVYIRRYCKLINNLLQLYLKGSKNIKGMQDKVTICGMSYGVKNGRVSIGEFDYQDIKLLARKFLISRCSDDLGFPLELDKCCQNLAQVVFATFCHGAIVVNKMVMELRKWLRGWGYTKEEINKILEALSQCSFGVEDGQASLIPTVRIDSDRDNNECNYYKYLYLREGPYAEHSGVEIRYCPRGMFFGDYNDNYAKTLNVFSKKLLNAFNVDNDEHYVGFISRDNTWKIYKRNERGDKPFRGGPTVYKESSNADCVSQIMSWSLSRFVENAIDNNMSDCYKKRLYFRQLKEELESIKESFKEEDLLPL